MSNLVLFSFSFFFRFTSENQTIYNCVSCGRFDLEKLLYLFLRFDSQSDREHFFLHKNIGRWDVIVLAIDNAILQSCKVTYRLHVEIGCVFASVRCQSLDL